MSKKPLIISVIVMLFSGFLFYFLFDNTLIITKPLYSVLNIDGPIISSNNTVINFLRNYGLDFLWASSMCIAVYITGYTFKYRIAVAVLLTIGLGIALEILQFIGLINGTPDLIDVLSEVIGCVCAILLIYVTSTKIS